MFTVRYLLVDDKWQERTFTIDRDDMTFAYVSAIRAVKVAMEERELDFIPLGDGQYIIWGQGKCQGYMSVKEHGHNGDGRD